MLGYLSVYTSVMANEQEASMKMYTLYQTACLKGFGLYFNILFCLEILCVKFFLYLWNLQEKNACENYHWHLLCFYFLTMSNYQWIYGVSDKT